MKNDVKEPINFRLGRSYREALARLARDRGSSLGALVREVVEEYVDRERRLAWEAEARRAAEALAAEAADPESPEAETLRWLEANLEELAREWIWGDEEE